MYVLHLHWHTPTQPGETGHFLLWMESALAPQPSRNRHKKSAQPHPFIANSDELRELLTAIRLRGKLPINGLDLWLPTNRFGPIPSPELPHDWEPDDNPAELSRWSVTGATLDAPQALNLLIWLHHNELPHPYRLGSDGRYWQLLFPFVLELLVQQLYRPTLQEIREKRGVRFEARWQTLLDGENEARQAAQLAAVMPAICRASATNPNETIPPRAILDGFLNHLTDAAVRHWATTREMNLPTSNDAAAVCKHLAAVHYTLAERFDADPFMLFRLRGKTQEEIVASLGTGPADEETAVTPEYVLAPPLSASLDSFWHMGPQINALAWHITPPDVPYPLLERLGDPDFLPEARRWLVKGYDAVTEMALQTAFPSATGDEV